VAVPRPFHALLLLLLPVLLLLLAAAAATGNSKYQLLRQVLLPHGRRHHGTAANTKANEYCSLGCKETRLFSVPNDDDMTQEIRNLLFHTKVKKSSSLLPTTRLQQQDQDGDDDDDDHDDDHDKKISTMNVLLQDLADHYDASDAQGKHELLQRVDDQIEELAERMAVLKSLSEHLQMGDDYLLQDQEVSAMKKFLWSTASSLKCGKHVEYLDGKEINGLKTEIISAIQKDDDVKKKNDQSMELFNLQEDYYLETKMKQEKEDELYNPHSYDAWLGF
jgi:hypothetical protein